MSVILCIVRSIHEENSLLAPYESQEAIVEEWDTSLWIELNRFGLNITAVANMAFSFYTTWILNIVYCMYIPSGNCIKLIM